MKSDAEQSLAGPPAQPPPSPPPAAAPAPATTSLAASAVEERVRSFSTASEASEDSTSALLPDVAFGPASSSSAAASHTGMGSPRSNRESQPLLGARHDVDEFNHWPGSWGSRVWCAWSFGVMLKRSFWREGSLGYLRSLSPHFPMAFIRFPLSKPFLSILPPPFLFPFLFHHFPFPL